MAENKTVTQVKALFQEAQSQYAGIQSAISSLKSKMSQIEQAIKNIETQINLKEMAIKGRETQIRECSRRIEQYQNEYSSLIDQSATAESEEEVQAIRARIEQLRQMANQEKQKASQMKAEVQQLNTEKAKLINERQQYIQNLQKLKNELTQNQSKCSSVASALNRAGNIVAMIASQMNNQAVAFQNGSSGRFRSAFGSAAQWRSQEAQQVNSLGTSTINLGRQYKKLATDSDSDRQNER